MKPLAGAVQRSKRTSLAEGVQQEGIAPREGASESRSVKAKAQKEKRKSKKLRNPELWVHAASSDR
jgi:hypothetical protein